jgi:hypothetical protein
VCVRLVWREAERAAAFAAMLEKNWSSCVCACHHTIDALFWTPGFASASVRW